LKQGMMMERRMSFFKNKMAAARKGDDMNR
jgi:hypothetical protein